MTAWLVCPRCKVKEWITATTEFIHCPTCHSPRHSEDDNGVPQVSWSHTLDPADWAVSMDGCDYITKDGKFVQGRPLYNSLGFHRRK